MPGQVEALGDADHMRRRNGADWDAMIGSTIAPSVHIAIRVLRAAFSPPPIDEYAASEVHLCSCVQNSGH
jgi:hypothetical protein